jgi:hypothetical protein
MNIIYLECKLLEITKCVFDFIGMSVFNQFLIDNICFVTFVSQIEGCGGLICRRRGLECPLGCQKPPKRARWRRRRAAVPSASSFVLLENEEQFIRLASLTTFLFLIRNQIFVTCISPS